MTRTTAIRRVVVLTAALLLLGTAFSSGLVAAHNPAGHQTAGADGPHYAGGTASDTAFYNNPTLNGSENPAFGGDGPAEWIGGGSVGNAQGSPHDSDH